MKTLSIGRDTGCDIVLNDHSDVISRRHAVLNITSTGKMTLIDQGRNGTYVNGIKITPNVPFPVKRNDVVSFAHVMQLNWALVPNYASRFYGMVGAIVAVIVLVGGALGFFLSRSGDTSGGGSVGTVATDTVKVQRADSAQTQRPDSTQTPKADTPRRKAPSPKKPKKTDDSAKKKDDATPKTEPAEQQPAKPATPLL